MNEYANMMEVQDLKVSTMLVSNVLTMEMGQGMDTIIELINEVNQEQKCKLELTIDEWGALSSVAFKVYELLCSRMESSKDLLEKSAIDKFLDTFESVVEKLNSDELDF